MSDGGGESGNQIEYVKKVRGNDEYARSIARIAVGQVCESVGFQGFQQSALDTFSDIACRYIKDIGKTANSYANLAGRTESNVLDIIQGLEDLGLGQGFSGASDVNHSLSSSGVIREVSQYVGIAEEIAFAYSIPRFPVIKEREPVQSFAQAGESPPSEHIPPWLPRFPDPKTYEGFALSRGKEAEMMADKVGQQHKVVEPSVISLQQRLISNGSELPVAVDHGGAAGLERAVDSNPFLASPLQFGEKEVSSVGLPPKFAVDGAEKNHGVGVNPVFTLEANPGCMLEENPGSMLESNPGSMLEAFGPAVEGMKKGTLGSEGSSRKFIRNSRPAIQLKFGIGKKFVDTSFRQRDKGIMETPSWFENGEVKNDKKRRAEQILRESMDVGKPTGLICKLEVSD